MPQNHMLNHATIPKSNYLPPQHHRRHLQQNGPSLLLHLLPNLIYMNYWLLSPEKNKFTHPQGQKDNSLLEINKNRK